MGFSSSLKGLESKSLADVSVSLSPPSPQVQTKIYPQVIPKRKKRGARTQRFSSKAELRSVLRKKDKSEWTHTDLVDYFHLCQMSLGSGFHYPDYKSEVPAAKILMKIYDVPTIVLIINQFFAHRNEFETSRFKLNNPGQCTFRMLNLTKQKKIIFKCLEYAGIKTEG